MGNPPAQTHDDEPRAGSASAGPSTSNPRVERLDLRHDAAQGERSHQSPSLEDRERQQEARAAFSANSEVIAVTPRRTAWTGGNPLSGPNVAQLHAASSEQPAAQASPPESRRSSEPDWTPSLAIGSIGADRLGAREAARRHVLQWERIYEYNRTHNPTSVQTVQRATDEARRVYEELLASEREEDVVPKRDLPVFQGECIQARVAVLRKTLLEAPDEGCEAMKTNITAALEGYDSGTIVFSENYTLIYAGHVVDSTCKSHAEFTLDRQERLDGYLEEHGPGYLWWEPPLTGSGASVLAKSSISLHLERADNSLWVKDYEGLRFRDDSCHYKVPLGFKKEDSLRRRTPSRRRRSVTAKEVQQQPLTTGKRKRQHLENVEEESGRKKPPSVSTLDELKAMSKRNSDNMTAPEDGDGTPTVFFDMVLDSGAELPVLLHGDFLLLGFGRKDMNAASVVDLNGVAGLTSTALCFELVAGIKLDSEDVSPGSHFFPARVVKLPPSVKTPLYGAFSGERLSGMLPFLAYYLTSAPGNGHIEFGEERAEVLGGQNMPAGRRYDPFVRAASRRSNGKTHLKTGSTFGGAMSGLRKVMFESKTEGGRTLIDEDVVSEDGKEIKSTVTLFNEDGSVRERFNQAHAKPNSR